MRTRNWSIRSKIIALVVVPLSALLALWIFATVLTAGPAVNLLSARTLLDTVGNPGEVLVGELQRERRASVVYLSDVHVSADALTAQRAATDRAAADFRSAASSNEAQDAASPALRSRISQILLDLNALPGNRKYVDIRRIDPVGAQGNFNNIIDTGFQMFAATATFGDEQIDRQIRALSAVGRGQEYLSRVDSLLAGANAAGKFDSAGRRELLEAVGTSQFLFTDGVNDLPSAERTNFQAFSTGTAFSRLRQLQDTLVTTSRAGAASPVTADQWQPAYDQSAQQLRAFEVNGATALADRATPVAVNVLVRLGAAGLLGLIALIVSLFVSIRVGRSLVGRLRRLRAEALEMAGERLPAVVRRLQRGEAVDVDVENPPLEYGRDEIGQVGRAFNAVQRTAVQSAVEEASVRRGINEVFLNIARRSQTLLHRQLALLDRMERRETEPQELEDLYRVDHLATRMRRHAEDLVILAGAAPGRGWRNPVSIIDVVRGAISEVEDYKRIDIRSIESAAILGRAVGDVIHLLAELLENAASFSPPQTRVLVTGQVLPNGYALEIEDRGLGMSSDAIDDANRRLLEPPDFDPADSARLGLFVVGQLAARHGIRVSLRPSAYGGVTAIVLVPGELVTFPPGPMALPAGPSPADKSWDRPLVGTGTDDPSRHSLAALQWQGGEELSSITVAGRPVALNGSTGGAGVTTAAERTQELPAAGGGGPSPSAVAGDLTVDGLVQRRRTKPRREPQTPQPAQFPTGLESPAELLRAAPVSPAPPSHTSLVSSALAATETPSADETVPLPSTEAVQAALPSAPEAVLPAATEAGLSLSTEAGLPLSTDDGLPKRVRQASLAPQLRAPAVEPTAVTARSPEQVRNIMTALQWGTNRGRLAAAGLDPDGQPPNRGEADTLAEAATVMLPAIREASGAGDGGPDDGESVSGESAGGGSASRESEGRPSAGGRSARRGSEGKDETDGRGETAAREMIDAAGGAAADEDQLNRPEEDA
jgi:signal transduction histidine kinase